ncbi:MAG: 16S rRNA (guanine(527)-N(7))-methyltransferase RsmG [Candidatus Peribacteria bacterium]|jgi:16S rRNA (guanine527-N7)-methyltransferase|nr:16S rRNA (guanine(527)-N(7))-methyltransferase RsmG [Candidatus Peribacteria bacterium]
MTISPDRTPLLHTFLKKNTQLNLSAIRDEEGVLVKHIQDSLEVNKVISFPTGALVADVGTGGGFPLLPLAITNPEVSFVGIDSVKKKTVAVNEMIAELKIKNAEVLRGRVEERKELFDYITARSVAYVDKLIPWSYRVLKKGGRFILMKQKNAEEKAVLLEVCKTWKLQLISEYFYSLFEGDIGRVIYVVEKR